MYAWWIVRDAGVFKKQAHERAVLEKQRADFFEFVCGDRLNELPHLGVHLPAVERSACPG